MKYWGTIVVVVIILTITHKVRILNKHVVQFRYMMETRNTSKLKVSNQAQTTLYAIFNEQITTDAALLCLRLLSCLGDDNRLEIEVFSDNKIKLKMFPKGSIIFRFDDKKVEYILESITLSTDADFDYSLYCP